MEKFTWLKALKSVAMHLRMAKMAKRWQDFSEQSVIVVDSLQAVSAKLDADGGVTDTDYDTTVSNLIKD